ncbi:MAG: arsenate reductase ArsC [Alphaproteobacteria bacterium]
MSKHEPLNVLFLCTGNSARSILSEALLNDLGASRFKAYSAGSRPSGIPHPDALAHLIAKGHEVSTYSSKSWDVFAKDDAPVMDIIVTVCGSAAGEVCPVWPYRPGHKPITVHWGADDPAHVEPLAARQKAFAQVYDLCRARINALLALPHEALRDRSALQAISEIQA